MSTISKTETPTGQEETAILLEEQARRIATLQESLKQACHNPHSNDRVIMQEVDRLVKERDDLKRKLANAELLIEKLKEEVRHWEEDFAMFDRAHEKAIDLWRKEHPDAGYTPDMSDLNEWMVGRVEKAEAVKELLRSALRGINEIAEVWNMYEFKQIRDIAKFALRTAEDSSVVDGPPAKQPEDSADADGDWDSVIDEEVEE